MLRNGNLCIIWSAVVLKPPGLESDREPSRAPGEEGINFSIWCGSTFRREAHQLRLRVVRRSRRLGGAPGQEMASEKLAVPGTNGKGTNPEHLLAVGWSACFLSAVKSLALR